MQCMAMRYVHPVYSINYSTSAHAECVHWFTVISHWAVTACSDGTWIAAYTHVSMYACITVCINVLHTYMYVRTLQIDN